MDKKQEILDAAFELFCLKGYRLSVSEIACAVGIKTPSLYSHFENKDQIIELMINQEIHRYFCCLEDHIAHLSHLGCKEAMKSLFDFIMGYFRDYKRLHFWRTIPLIPKEQLKYACSQLIASKDSEINRQMQLCIAKGLRDGELRPDVSQSTPFLYLCMIQGVLDGMLMFPGEEIGKVFAQRVFDAFWEGICALPSKQEG